MHFPIIEIPEKIACKFRQCTQNQYKDAGILQIIMVTHNSAKATALKIF